MGRKRRAEVTELESKLDDLAKVVDGFYEVLGERNWVFHDTMNVDTIRAIIRGGGATDEVEQRLIQTYQDPEDLQFMVRNLYRHEALWARRDLITRARADYVAGRFYSDCLGLAHSDGWFRERRRPSTARTAHP